MGKNLSEIIQAKPSMLIILIVGWRIARILIYIIGEIYFLINSKERKIIEDAISKVFQISERQKKAVLPRSP